MKHSVFAPATALATFAALLLSGCSALKTSAGTGTAPAAVQLSGTHGSLHGGQQPVAGSSVQLYQAGTTGYGTGALALVPGNGVLTDSGGNFNFTGNYQCATGSQVYLVASGGNAGTGSNNSLVMMAALGLCDNINANTYVSLNEVTTVAGVWALAPFMNGVNIGSPASNAAGLAQAFADVGSLVDTAHGSALSSTATVTVPTTEIYTLADILASCVNTGGASGSGACDSLFSYTTPSGGTAPTDTLAAALNMARYPATNVANLLALVPATAPFQPTLASAADFTISVAYSGSGISAPTGLAVDASGNIWATNSGSNSVTKLSHTGTVLSGTGGFTAGPLSSPSAVALDANGNAWITSEGNNLLVELASGGTLAGSFSGGGLSSPTAIAFDGLGNSWISNSGNSSASKFSATGAALSPSAGFTAAGAAPVTVAVNPR